MRLLSTVLPVERAPVIRTPSPEFEEMTLPQVESGPPIWLLAEFSIRTPSPPLPGLPGAEEVAAAGRQADQVGRDDGPGRGRSDDLERRRRRCRRSRCRPRHPTRR